MKGENKRLGCSALQLKVIAMISMLLDHMWATVLPGAQWATVVGRLAFPIFAFQIAEGFFKTSNRKAYMRRMLVFALISEIPFNLVAGGSVFYPIHQNVMFTFLLAMLLMTWMERVRGHKLKYAAVSLICVVLGYLLGLLTMVDYYHYGIFMVLLFYWTYRLPKSAAMVIQLLAMLYINDAMAGRVLIFEVLGRTVEFSQQMAAVFALVPIWLYNGQKGYSSKAVQYAVYWFYPVHLLVLYLIYRFIFR